MPQGPSIPLPAPHALRKLGRDLALARRKRGISTSDMAARLFVSRDTLWRLEKDDPNVSLGTLATAAFILQLHDRPANLAARPPMHSPSVSMNATCPNASAAPSHEHGGSHQLEKHDAPGPTPSHRSPQPGGFV